MVCKDVIFCDTARFRALFYYLSNLHYNEEYLHSDREWNWFLIFFLNARVIVE